MIVMDVRNIKGHGDAHGVRIEFGLGFQCVEDKEDMWRVSIGETTTVYFDSEHLVRMIGELGHAVHSSNEERERSDPEDEKEADEEDFDE